MFPLRLHHINLKLVDFLITGPFNRIRPYPFLFSFCFPINTYLLLIIRILMGHPVLLTLSINIVGSSYQIPCRNLSAVCLLFCCISWLFQSADSGKPKVNLRTHFTCTNKYIFKNFYLNIRP